MTCVNKRWIWWASIATGVFVSAKPAAVSAAAAAAAAATANTAAHALEGLTTLQAKAMNTFIFDDTTRPLVRDSIALGLVFAAALSWVELGCYLQKRGTLSSNATRKLLHITTGPLFIATWPLFSQRPYAPLLASVPLLLQLVRLAIIREKTTTTTTTTTTTATSSSSSETSSLASAITRREDDTTARKIAALRGPVVYICVLLGITLLLWRRSVPAIVAVAQLAGGDGMAELVGTRIPSLKWKWSGKCNKSLSGSLGFVAGGFSLSLLLLSYFHALGLIELNPWNNLLRLLFVSVIAAAAELVSTVVC